MGYTKKVENKAIKAIFDMKIVKILEKVGHETEMTENPYAYSGKDLPVMLTYGKVRMGGTIVIPVDMLEDYKCLSVEQFVIETVGESPEFAPVAGVEYLSRVPGHYNKFKADNVKVEKVMGDEYKVEFDMVGDDWEGPVKGDPDDVSDWELIHAGLDP
jgi:hypothetical protein